MMGMEQPVLAREAFVQIEAAPLESQLLRSGQQAFQHGQRRVTGEDKGDGQGRGHAIMDMVKRSDPVEVGGAGFGLPTASLSWPG
jgi:hypothetical protein